MRSLLGSAITAASAVTLMASILLSPAALVAAHPANASQIPNGNNVKRLGTAWPAVGHVDAAGVGVLNSFGLAFQAAAVRGGHGERRLTMASSIPVFEASATFDAWAMGDVDGLYADAFPLDASACSGRRRRP
jgi:hypothetical protein